jgi:hypothetical protein
MALGLTAICLRLFDRPAADVEDHLVVVSERTESGGNQHAMAIALYALTAERHDVKAFRVAV